MHARQYILIAYLPKTRREQKEKKRTRRIFQKKRSVRPNNNQRTND